MSVNALNVQGQGRAAGQGRRGSSGGLPPPGEGGLRASGRWQEGWREEKPAGREGAGRGAWRPSPADGSAWGIAPPNESARGVGPSDESAGRAVLKRGQPRP
jgi:hypothetical protein